MGECFHEHLVRGSYDKQASGFITNINDNVELHHPAIGSTIRHLVQKEKAELEALPRYADTHFSSTWDRGDLYYPCQDQITNQSGEWKFVDPFMGNAEIGYARLNVEDGQKKVWERPWTREIFAGRPWVDGLDYSQGVDCLRGWWADEEQAMIVTLQP
ncbi:hypothetical protein BDV12DRAFT_100281 [Aspergillus spectabilis]